VTISFSDNILHHGVSEWVNMVHYSAQKKHCKCLGLDSFLNIFPKPNHFSVLVSQILGIHLHLKLVLCLNSTSGRCKGAWR